MERFKSDLFIFVREFLQVFMDFIFYLLPQQRPSKDALAAAKIVAHRGWHNNNDIKENTLEAFQLALDHKLWGIEFDIRWTKDLVPMVHHDPSLERVWEYERDICNMSFNELRAICPQIPSLEEVVARFGGKIHLFIEIKDENFKELARQNEILSFVLQDLAPEIDFHFLGLKKFLLEKFPLYDLSCYFLVANFNIAEMSKCAQKWGCAGVMGHYLLCTEDLLKRHRGAGQVVATGFTRTTNCLYREINRDIEWIFTNHPWNLIKAKVKVKVTEDES